MNPYFQSTTRRMALIGECASWLGTPFHPHGRTKGAGVDCVGLAAQIYIALGLIHEFKPPTYTVGGADLMSKSAIEEFLTCLPELRPVFGTETRLQTIGCEIIPGDLLVFQMGRVTHHVGLAMSETEFLHCHQHTPVRINDLRDPTWLGRLRRVYRPTEVA